MDSLSSPALEQRLSTRFESLYPGLGRQCVSRLELLIGRYEQQLERVNGRMADRPYWDQSDVILITYGDSIRQVGEKPLTTLHRFLNTYLHDVIGAVHILPFSPYSSDDGFSVIDYRVVNPDLGDWSDVVAISRDFDLMADLVLNHCSKLSAWFRDFVAGVAPGRDYFICVEPFTDLAQVTRPRQSPLLTTVKTRMGEHCVWTTFSSDQIDLNFANPDVLLEFLDILLLYVVQGSRFIRLDAIAYLWKQIGTSCIHLPQTHEVVKLFYDLLSLVAPHVKLITETNVPHKENVSYFGQADEAHMVYNFSLAPLLLSSLQQGSGQYLTAWARELEDPPAGCTYLNFTASHDGVGVRPLEGIVPPAAVDQLASRVKQRGGHVSSKANPDGSSSPYELNITYFDALGSQHGQPDPEHEKTIQRFLCSQTVAMSLKGIPAVYLPSLIGGRNDKEGVERLGYPRAINRHKYDYDLLTGKLDDEKSIESRVLIAYSQLLRIRRGQPAFHPDAEQQVLELSNSTFTVCRRSHEPDQTILSISNLTHRGTSVKLQGIEQWLPEKPWFDLIRGKAWKRSVQNLKLEPYQTVWLTQKA